MTIYYTGRGDKGKSEMGEKKIAKDHPLFELLGTLDELSSWLGVCRYKKLKQIQEDLFIAQAEIGMKAMGRRYTLRVTRSMTERLQREIMAIDKVVPQIKKFIIPGASELSAKLDYARALARRAERAAVRAKASPELLQYLNRLSSMLFALARLVNFRLKFKEENPKYR
ncbi:MAG: cob(I)yrinic acid a,c-diamide adenosyltransferase [Patescibacteria group bacterium]